MFIYVFCGSGLSIDIAKCCDSIAGISLGFSNAKVHDESSGCCAVVKATKKEKQCCEDVEINTVINSVPGISTSYKSISKPVIKIAEAKHPVMVTMLNADFSNQVAYTEASDQQYPVPILIKKRVLQI